MPDMPRSDTLGPEACPPARKDAWPEHRSLLNSLERSLANLASGEPVAVAFSGGADSAALAIASASVCRASQRPLFLFHVHHGLYEQADEWTERAAKLASQLEVPFIATQVNVAVDSGKGLEASARNARYQALAKLAEKHSLNGLLLAHHRQDQAETVLLRLLRGAGVQGLAAMQTDSTRQGLRLLRPWLDIDRSELLALVAAHTQRTGWLPVVDPSNTDPQYARGALRRELLPALNQHWPAWQQTLSRHARQATEAIEILSEVAATDLASLEPATEDHSFSLKHWRNLSPGRQTLVLRYWLQQQGVAMPGDRRLAELLRQLRQLHALGHDRDLLWRHDSFVLRCHQGRVMLSVE